MIRCVALTLLATVLAGCSGQGTNPVHGTVKFPDGTPLKGGAIYFSNPEQRISARGDIAEDGTFTIGTHEPGDGAPAGKYKVYVKPAGPKDSSMKREIVIDPKFESDATSGLEVTINAGPNEVPIEVQRPK